MNSILKFLLGISILSISSCSSTTQKEEDSLSSPAQDKADSTIVIINAGEKDLFSFQFMDMFGNQFSLSKGKNVVPLDVFISEGYSDTYFPILSNDTIVFNRNEKGIWIATDSTGREMANLNFFSWYRSTLDKGNSLLLNTFDYTQKFMNPSVYDNPEMIDRMLSADIEDEIKIFTDYQHEFKLDNHYSTVWKHFIEDRLLSNVLFRIAGRPDHFPEDYLKKFTSAIIAEKLGNDSLLLIPEYKRSAFFALKLLEYIEKKDKNSTSKTLYDLISTHFSGATKDILLTKLVLDEDHTNNDELLTQFYQDCKNAEFISYVKEALRSIPDPSNEMIISNSGEITNLSKLLSDNDVNYVDFWASWCAPCRAEMPASKVLKKKFEGRVNFIYLSIDKDQAAWKKASNFVGLGESYIINKASKSEIIKQFSVNEIPRYILFNRKGEVVKLNAPRPGSPEIEPLLEKLVLNAKATSSAK